MARSTRTIVPSLAAVAVLTACTAAGTSTGPSPDPDPASTTPVPGEPWLLYQGQAQRGAQVRLIRPDGTDDHALVPDLRGTDQTNPDWSPDGEQVVFVLRDGRTEDLWVTEADGSGAHRVVDCRRPCTFLDDPAWSPDGDSIAYARTTHHGRYNHLEIIDVDSGDSRGLVGSAREFFAGPRWSPDGRQLVCESVTKAGPRLDAEVTGVTLTLVDTREPSRVADLTDPELFAATADWSPDGERIVYSGLPDARADRPDLFLIDPLDRDVTRLTRLVARGGYAAEPTYTPDGRTLVFSGQASTDEAPEWLLRVDASGGPVSPVVDRDGRHPRWRPGTTSER